MGMTTTRFGSQLPRVLAPWAITRSEREPAGRAFAELGITTLLFSIYVSARGGAQVAGAARRLLR
jgi:hypothetical protein